MKLKRRRLVNLKRILRCFEVMSGLRINYHKSQVCGVGVADGVLGRFADILNCKTKKLPVKYLRLPLGANPSCKATWKPVVEKVRSRLASWKRKTLSHAGRLTLIKSALASLPVYYMSLFKMPDRVARILERLQASFLWGGTEVRRKVHMVKWEELTKSLEQGGLGLRRVRVVNSCLLIKW